MADNVLFTAATDTLDLTVDLPGMILRRPTVDHLLHHMHHQDGDLPGMILLASNMAVGYVLVLTSLVSRPIHSFEGHVRDVQDVEYVSPHTSLAFQAHRHFGADHCQGLLRASRSKYVMS